jgi:hypothetical protein
MSAGTSVPEQAARLVERAQKVALCLDFDGTLSPIVEDPQAARPLPGIVELLGQLLEQSVHIAGGTARVVSQGHCGTAEHVDIRHHAPLGQPVTEAAECLLDALPIEQRRRFAHAASIS